jgi:hypothetical protein
MMNSNYEWQLQFTRQRLQKRLMESRQHRMGKQRGSPPREFSAEAVILIPLRFAAAIFSFSH